MINETVNAISERLYDFFGEDIKIYTDTVKQGFKKPCFVVTPLKSEMSRQQKHRWYLVSSYKIEYFSNKPEEQVRTDCYDIQSKLFDALSEIILQGSPVIGIKMSSQLNDGNIGSVTVHQDGMADTRLEFFVNYDMFLNEIPSSEPMEKMTSNVNLGITNQ